MNVFNKKFKLLESCSSVLGLKVIWKNTDGEGYAKSPDKHFLHCHEFCNQVKQNPARLEKCRQDDIQNTFRHASQHRRPFKKICHAGVLEWVIPIFHNDILQGALYLGPFQSRKGCACSGLHSSYDQLRREPRQDFRNVTTLLEPVGKQLALQEPEKSVTKNRLHPAISQAVEWIQNDCGKDWNLNDMAYKCCMSRSRLTALFRAETGVSFNRFLTRYRVKIATELLRKPHLSLQQIALRTGFGTQNYLSTVFKREMGISPLSYRKVHETKLGV